MSPPEFLHRESEEDMELDDIGELSGPALALDLELAQRASQLNLNDPSDGDVQDEDTAMA